MPDRACLSCEKRRGSYPHARRYLSPDFLFMPIGTVSPSAERGTIVFRNTWNAERLIAIQGGGVPLPHATFKSEWGKCKPQELLLTRYSRFLE